MNELRVETKDPGWMDYKLPKLIHGNYYLMFAISDQILFRFDKWCGDGEHPKMMCLEFILGIDYNKIRIYYNCEKEIPSQAQWITKEEYEAILKDKNVRTA